MLSQFQKTTHTQQQTEDSSVPVLPAPSLDKAATLQGEGKGQKEKWHQG